MFYDAMGPCNVKSYVFYDAMGPCNVKSIMILLSEHQRQKLEYFRIRRNKPASHSWQQKTLSPRIYV